jgi:hypothetical protein
VGILYIDEAGNSGVRDTGQPNLIYGGPYIKPSQWKDVLVDYEKNVAKYKSLIYGKFNKPEDMPQSFDKLSSEIDFFVDFHFHATEIMNGRKLWGKLNNNQPFNLLADLITIMEIHNVKFHAGILDKSKLLSKLNEENKKIDSGSDFKTLLPLFFNNFEREIGEEDYVVVIADGSPEEKEILNQTLQSSSIKKCIPEQVIKKAQLNPFLQLADAGLWIIQAYHRLEESDTNNKSQQIRNLYKQLEKIMTLYIT